MGFEIVRVHFSGGKRPSLQIMAEHKQVEGAPLKRITVDDCADISRTVSAILDVEDPISSAYSLEVSSPGIDRPLTRRKDFVFYAGHAVRIDSKMPIDGRKRFMGKLLGMENDMIKVSHALQTYEIPFENVARAKLELTNDLISEALKEAEAAEKSDSEQADAEKTK